MAQNISNVRSINDAPKRGRQTKAAKEAEKAALEAKRLREDEARGLKHPKLPDGGEVLPDLSFMIATRDQAAAAGHDVSLLDKQIAEREVELGVPASNRTVGRADNGGLDQGLFLRWVNKLNEHDDKGDKLKLALKAWRTERKLMRKEAGGDGIVMGTLDEALEDLKTEQVDLLAREERRRLYHEYLGIPLTVQGEIDLSADDEAQAKARWRRRGLQDGRLGKERKLPEGIPPENGPDYLGGHEEGQMDLMRGSPLTRDAFKAPPAEGVVGVVRPDTLTLGQEAFATGTLLEDCNLTTLREEHAEAFAAATNVVVVYGDKRRVLKEPDASVPGGIYIDTGTEDAPVSDIEPVELKASDLA